MLRPKRLLLALATGALVLAGCGSTDPPADEGYLVPDQPAAVATLGALGSGADGETSHLASTPPPPSVSPDAYVGYSESGPTDLYLPDPIPAGKPKPVEPEDAVIDRTQSASVALSINAATILNHRDQFNTDKESALPPGGVIMAHENVAFSKG